MTRLALSRLHFPVTTLGPGRRVGVWFQGCSIRCPGCVSLDTWSAKEPDTDCAAVLAAIQPFANQADGLTVSGGEPFDQVDALHALLVGWRGAHSGSVLVYSGYPLERLQPLLARFDGLIDALVTDPLQLQVPQTLPLRGSDNQRLTLLTASGRAAFAHLDVPQPNAAPALDVMFDDETGTVFFAGVPRRGDMKRLASLLLRAGHQAATTEDKSASACR
ncbi:4Fe-4S cluster-binding domain-containing protein [Methylobacterium sp. WL9]|uniref:4Fe-4S cluster-binding domain-containing protein n=1 Tax=Methylobacterium sp. WL9 TaxID=2603898 RepID=UPI0011C8E60D|nr:4Fe-4S cluster-binding domain-containing protein [Methylobacterium sp. WL9]TXN20394.1 radical SAM protein [Methylobacterium sp. WL9]